MLSGILSTMPKSFPLFPLLALLLMGCTALDSGLSEGLERPEIASPAETESVYIAPTLPPEYTLTPTVTITPTLPPTPTPFQVASIEASPSPEGETQPTETPALFVGQWELYESRRLNAAIQFPPQLSPRDFGQSILIGDANLNDETTPLFVEIRFDSAGSYRLPEGIDATNPRNVLEGVVRELEETYTEVVLVRSIQDVNFNGINAAEVAARVRLVSGTTEQNLNWYLAVAIRDETVVRFYASSPASAGVTYISIAERIAESFYFLE
jgi:hypothetical protein